MLISVSLDPILIKIWHLVKYNNTSKLQFEQTSHSQKGSRNICSRLHRTGSPQTRDTSSQPTLPIHLYLRLIITIQLAMFIVDDDQLYQIEEIRAVFQKNWESIARAHAHASGHQSFITFKKFKQDIVKLVNDRILLSSDVTNILNSQFRRVLHLVQRQPMLSQTQGPSTHICLLSLVDLTDRF